MCHSLIGRMLHDMLSFTINAIMDFMKFDLSFGYACFLKNALMFSAYLHDLCYLCVSNYVSYLSSFEKGKNQLSGLHFSFWSLLEISYWEVIPDRTFQKLIGLNVAGI